VLSPSSHSFLFIQFKKKKKEKREGKPSYLSIPQPVLSFSLFFSYSEASSCYGCESWTIKKADHQRIDAFELWCWRRLLRVPSTARTILKEISPEYSLEGLKLKLQYFGHLM